MVDCAIEEMQNTLNCIVESISLGSQGAKVPDGDMPTIISNCQSACQSVLAAVKAVELGAFLTEDEVEKCFKD